MEKPFIVYVEGAEWASCETHANARQLFDYAVYWFGGEVALMAWKPRYSIYLRERLSITAKR